MSKPSCTIECEDCGRFAVMNNNFLSIFTVDGEFFGMTRCVFCDRVVKNSVSKEVALRLFWEGVKVFDFNTGQQIFDQKVFNRK